MIFPSSILPLPQASYSDLPVSNVASTTMASGRVRRRRLGAGVYYRAKLRWHFSPEELETFRAWWEHVLQVGTSEFTITMATGDTIGPHRVLFVGEPEESLSGYFWQVSVDAIVLSRPALSSEYIFGLLAIGLPKEAFILMEERLDSVVNVEFPVYM